MRKEKHFMPLWFWSHWLGFLISPEYCGDVDYLHAKKGNFKSLRMKVISYLNSYCRVSYVECIYLGDIKHVKIKIISKWRKLSLHGSFWCIWSWQFIYLDLFYQRRAIIIQNDSKAGTSNSCFLCPRHGNSSHHTIKVLWNICENVYIIHLPINE